MASHARGGSFERIVHDAEFLEKPDRHPAILTDPLGWQIAERMKVLDHLATASSGNSFFVSLARFLSFLSIRKRTDMTILGHALAPLQGSQSMFSSQGDDDIDLFLSSLNLQERKLLEAVAQESVHHPPAQLLVRELFSFAFAVSPDLFGRNDLTEENLRKHALETNSRHLRYVYYRILLTKMKQAPERPSLLPASEAEKDLHRLESIPGLHDIPQEHFERHYTVSGSDPYSWLLSETESALRLQKVLAEALTRARIAELVVSSFSSGLTPGRYAVMTDPRSGVIVTRLKDLQNEPLSFGVELNASNAHRVLRSVVLQGDTLRCDLRRLPGNDEYIASTMAAHLYRLVRGIHKEGFVTNTVTLCLNGGTLAGTLGARLQESLQESGVAVELFSPDHGEDRDESAMPTHVLNVKELRSRCERITRKTSSSYLLDRS